MAPDLRHPDPPKLEAPRELPPVERCLGAQLVRNAAASVRCRCSRCGRFFELAADAPRRCPSCDGRKQHGN